MELLHAARRCCVDVLLHAESAGGVHPRQLRHGADSRRRRGPYGIRPRRPQHRTAQLLPVELLVVVVMVLLLLLHGSQCEHGAACVVVKHKSVGGWCQSGCCTWQDAVLLLQRLLLLLLHQVMLTVLRRGCWPRVVLHVFIFNAALTP